MCQAGAGAVRTRWLPTQSKQVGLACCYCQPQSCKQAGAQGLFPARLLATASSVSTEAVATGMSCGPPDVSCIALGASRVCSLTIANALPLQQQPPPTGPLVQPLWEPGLPPVACSWTSASPLLQELRPLVYPVVQLLSGTVRLVPTQRYFPLRLRCVRALITLSQATGVFIPTSPLLLEMLKWGELSKAPRAAGGEGGSPVGLLARQLRVSKNTLRMRGFQEEIVMQVGGRLAAAASHTCRSGLARCQLGAGTYTGSSSKLATHCCCTDDRGMEPDAAAGKFTLQLSMRAPQKIVMHVGGQDGHTWWSKAASHLPQRQKRAPLMHTHSMRQVGWGVGLDRCQPSARWM